MNAVAVLVLLLGHPSWYVRESVESALARLRHVPAGQLEAAAKASDPEVASRAGRLLRSERQRQFEAMVKRHQPLPWIDSLPREHFDRCAITHDYFNQAEYTTADPVAPLPYWHGYRVAMHLWLWDQFDAGVPIERLERTLVICEYRCWWYVMHGNMWED